MTANGALRDAFAGRRVFLTGHTGFKGSWLTGWLHSLGCEVTGYALRPEGGTNLFALAGIERQLAAHHEADIRDQVALAAAMAEARPDLVIHMAAQSLVRRGYDRPVETWSTNVMGAVNLFEGVRACPSVRAVLVVTTDKCYQNNEWHWGYREQDTLGGRDPYSASKAGAELVTQSYRDSFFASGGPLVASARAGNVIGGGDWSQDRLVADAARAVEAGRTMIVRNPAATRPWQHVLDCLGGYLSLAARLLQGDREAAASFNFGPAASDNLSVGELLGRLQGHWPELRWEADAGTTGSPHEATFLYLDSSLARRALGWRPRWGVDDALRSTAGWYRAVLDDPSVAGAVTRRQLEEYIAA